MVVIDNFSKAAHFETLPTTFSTYNAVEVFTTMIWRLHYYPKQIIPDKEFMSKFWKSLFQL